MRFRLLLSALAVSMLAVALVVTGSAPVARAARQRAAASGGANGVFAGRDRRIPVGTADVLVARVNGHTDSDAHWKLVSGPREGPRAINGRKVTPVTLRSPAGTTARFTPQTPGEYTFQFDSGSAGSQSTDRVTDPAVPGRVFVPVDTNTGGGIRIGDRTYPGKPASGNWVQVIVLDRATLEVLSNTTYTKRSELVSALDGLHAPCLHGLDPCPLVVAVRHQTSAGDISLYPDALESIGVNPPTQAPYPTFSAIGVPGWKVGQADQLADFGSARGLQGYLTPDQHRNYGFVPAEHGQLTFEPKPLGPCQSACDRDGYLVHFYNPFTLSPETPVDGTFYDTDGQNLSVAQQTAEATKMIFDLQTSLRRSLVTIQTVGTRLPGTDQIPPPVGKIDGATMDRLAAAVASFGGTRNAFLQTALKDPDPKTGGLSYALVGWDGAGEGNGAELASHLVDSIGDGSKQGIESRTEGPAAPSLTVALRPDNQSYLRPAGVSDVGGLSDALTDEVMKAPSGDWRCGDDPCSKAPGVVAAMSYIGTHDVTQLGPDPRAEYGVAEWNAEQLLAIHSALGALRGTEPPGSHDIFDQVDWDAAIDQLLKENAEIAAVRGYFDKLAAPFSDSELSNYIDAQTIADTVFTQSQAPDDLEVPFHWLDLTKTVLKLSGHFTGGATSAVAELIDLGQWFAGATATGAPTYEDLTIKAHEFGAAVQEQAAQIKYQFETLGNVIVSDPAKLAYFAKADCAPGPECPAALQSDPGQPARTADAYRHSIKSLAYQTFAPLVYTVYTLIRYGNDAHGAENRGPWAAPPKIPDYICGINGSSPHPFENVSPLASVATLSSVDPSIPAGKPRSYYQTYIIAHPADNYTFHAVGADEALMKKMFDPVDKGGLGISPTHFALAAPQRWWYLNARDEAQLCWWGD